MQTRDLRSSAVLVGLPFRSAWALWGGVYAASDRAQAAFLYRGVFNPERWITGEREDENWTTEPKQPEPWTQKLKQSEVWAARSQQPETWTDKPKASEAWTRNYDD